MPPTPRHSSIVSVQADGSGSVHPEGEPVSWRASDSKLSTRVPDCEPEPLLSQATYRLKKVTSSYKNGFKGFGFCDWLAFFLPCFGWLRTYQWRGWLVSDLVAGLTVAAMVIPQGMSYANLAGLPNVYGLYGSFVPVLVYSLLGSSRQLAVGPVAVTSTLLGNGLQKIFGGNVNPDPNTPDDPALQHEYNRAAIQVAFLAGCFYTAVGLLRLGWLTSLLSHSVISGFMTGASITIALSQVKYILGLKIGRADALVGTLELILDNLDQFRWREFCMGMAFIFILYVCRAAGKGTQRFRFLRFMGPLSVCVLSIALMNIFKWYENPSTKDPYIRRLNAIPSGLPPFTAGWWLPLKDVGHQVTLALLICIIDVVESISIAKALAQKNKYQLNFTQELRAMGIANLAGAMFSSYTTTGSFSRSAVNDAAGAKTPLAQFVTAMVLMVTLLALTPVFKNMSQNVQGAIIIVGVLGLMDFREGVHLFRVNKLDFLVWSIAFLFTLFLGVEVGIGASVGLSLVIVIYKSAFPRITTLGRLTNSTIYRSTKMYRDAATVPGMLLLRIDAPLYFANVESVKEYIRTKLASEQRTQRVSYLVLDMSPVTDVDATALHFLQDFIDELAGQGVQLVLANPSQEALTSLKKAKVHKKIGFEFIHASIHEAVAYCQGHLAEEAKAGGPGALRLSSRSS